MLADKSFLLAGICSAWLRPRKYSFTCTRFSKLHEPNETVLQFWHTAISPKTIHKPPAILYHHCFYLLSLLYTVTKESPRRSKGRKYELHSQAGTDADKKDKRLGFVKTEVKTPKDT